MNRMAEKEYIEREAIKYEQWAVGPLNEPLMVVRKKTIDSIPAADVAPVVHGRWGVYLGGKELMCSACKATFWDEEQTGGSNYCPNCGAKMDLEDGLGRW